MHRAISSYAGQAKTLQAATVHVTREQNTETESGLQRSKHDQSFGLGVVAAAAAAAATDDVVVQWRLVDDM